MYNKLNLKNKNINDNIEKFMSHVNHAFNDANFNREERTYSWKDAWYYYLLRRPHYRVANLANIDGTDENEKAHAAVEPVIRDAVDAILPSLLDTFADNIYKTTEFRASSKFVPSQITEAVNKTMNDSFIRDNNGFELLKKVFTEALITGNAYTKQSVVEEIEEEEYEFEEGTPVELLFKALEEYKDTDLTQFNINEEEATFSVKAKDSKAVLTKINKKELVEYIPFGALYVDPHATDIEEARHVHQRHTMTVGEALDMGWDEELISRAGTVDALNETATSLKKIHTHGQFTNDDDFVQYATDELERRIHVYEHYIYSSAFTKGKVSKLYQVWSISGEYSGEPLEICEAEFIPFTNHRMEETPDSFWGNSLYDKLKDVQDHMTRATKLEIDNAAALTYGRYTVIKGSCDMRQLLDWRPGGIIETTAQGAVNLMPSHQISPSFYNVTQRIQDSAKRYTYSAAGIGQENLNNVAASTVALAVQQEELEGKKIAKSFSNSIRRMNEQRYKNYRLHNLPLKTEEGEVVLGKQLPKRCEFVIDTQTKNDSQRIVNFLSQAMAGEQGTGLVTDQNRFEAYSFAMEELGAPVDKFFTNPEEIQPTVEEQLQKQMEVKKMGLDLKQQEAEIGKLVLETVAKEAQIKREQAKTVIEAAKMQDGTHDKEMALKQREMAFKEKELAVKAEAAKADISITQQSGKQTSIAGFPG